MSLAIVTSSSCRWNDSMQAIDKTRDEVKCRILIAARSIPPRNQSSRTTLSVSADEAEDVDNAYGGPPMRSTYLHVVCSNSTRCICRSRIFLSRWIAKHSLWQRSKNEKRSKIWMRSLKRPTQSWSLGVTSCRNRCSRNTGGSKTNHSGLQ